MSLSDSRQPILEELEEVLRYNIPFVIQKQLVRFFQGWKGHSESSSHLTIPSFHCCSLLLKQLKESHVLEMIPFHRQEISYSPKNDLFYHLHLLYLPLFTVVYFYRILKDIIYPLFKGLKLQSLNSKTVIDVSCVIIFLEYHRRAVLFDTFGSFRGQVSVSIFVIPAGLSNIFHLGWNLMPMRLSTQVFAESCCTFELALLPVVSFNKLFQMLFNTISSYNQKHLSSFSCGLYLLLDVS